MDGSNKLTRKKRRIDHAVKYGKLLIGIEVKKENPKEKDFKARAFDSQYSNNHLRTYAQDHGIKTAIPYPANQKPKTGSTLRVADDFKTYGPPSLKRSYRKLSLIELVFAWPKEHLSISIHKVR